MSKLHIKRDALLYGEATRSVEIETSAGILTFELFVESHINHKYPKHTWDAREEALFDQLPEDEQTNIADFLNEYTVSFGQPSAEAAGSLV